VRPTSGCRNRTHGVPHANSHGDDACTIGFTAAIVIGPDSDYDSVELSRRQAGMQVAGRSVDPGRGGASAIAGVH